MKYSETYVTVEQAKALKRLGFDWECDAYFCLDDKEHLFIKKPPLHLAAKWLREVKGIAVNVTAHDGGLYEWDIVFLPNAAGTDGIGDRSPWYKTYEEALSDGITTVLDNLDAQEFEKYF